MRFLVLITTAIGFLVGACSQPPPPSAPKPDLAAEEKAIRDMDARWLAAVQSHDPRAEAAAFASDGVAYREHNEPLVGPSAYQAFQTKFYADNPMVKTTWSTEAIRLSESGDLAVQTGEFITTGLGPKGDREDKGRFVTVWKRVNGEWKVAYDIGSTTMPEAVAAIKP